MEQAAPPPPVSVVPKKNTTITTRMTGLQKNVQWRNEKSYAEDVGTRYNNAFSKCTQIFADLKAGKIQNPLTQQEYIDNVNKEFSLDGEGREGSREKHMLSISTVARAVRNGQVGVPPQKKGKAPKISRDFLRLVALHTNMEQVGDQGELDTAQIKATMMAATMNTIHDGDFNLQYAWEQVRKENCDIMIPTGVKQAEDIRWKWVTYEKAKQFFDDLKVSLHLYLPLPFFVWYHQLT